MVCSMEYDEKVFLSFKLMLRELRNIYVSEPHRGEGGEREGRENRAKDKIEGRGRTLEWKGG